jgi:hypothetical protein
MWRIVVILLAGLLAVGVSALASLGAQPSAPKLGESVVIVPNVADSDARRDDTATELVTVDTDPDGNGDGTGDDPPGTSDGVASWVTRVGDTAAGDPVAEPSTAATRASAATAASRDGTGD